MIHIQNFVYYRKFKHSGIFRYHSEIFSHIVAYLEPCVTLAYSEPYNIQNPGIFRTLIHINDLPQALNETGS